MILGFDGKMRNWIFFAIVSLTIVVVVWGVTSYLVPEQKLAIVITGCYSQEA